MSRGTASTIAVLIPRMPDVFINPNLQGAPGKTNYLGILGKECIFDGSDKGIGLRQITDGTTNTIAVVEANADQAVEWTKPDDWKYDAKNPKVGILHLRPGGCSAVFADGHVQFISETIEAATLNALLTRAAAKLFAPSFYQAKPFRVLDAVTHTAIARHEGQQRSGRLWNGGGYAAPDAGPEAVCPKFARQTLKSESSTMPLPSPSALE